jgi:heme a synthase
MKFQIYDLCTFEVRMGINTEMYRKKVGLWLLFMCGLVFVMVVVGGLTRLTQSGLSMVEWRPIMGTLPPFGEVGWTEVFEKYKNSPEYQKINLGMSLAEFKKIFWFEYGHRLLGRIIGLAFFFPFLYFLYKKAIPTKLLPQLIGLFFLGGMQGVIGWWMVKSGLVDRPDVSHLRLTVHLGMAFLLYVLLLWTGLTHIRKRQFCSAFQSRYRAGLVLITLVYTTVLSGGLVAGLNAGAQFNTFPLMAGQWIPKGLYYMEPWYTNIFENMMTIQFNHRYLAITTATLVLSFFWWNRRINIGKRGSIARYSMLFMVLTQVGLGIATLLSAAWLPLASLHQTGAIILLTTVIWTTHEICYAQNVDSISQKSQNSII